MQGFKPNVPNQWNGFEAESLRQKDRDGFQSAPYLIQGFPRVFPNKNPRRLPNVDELLLIVQTINSYLSNYVLIVLLIGTGLFFTIRTRFVQVLSLIHI